MRNTPLFLARKLCWTALLALALLPAAGCMGFSNYLLYAIYGPPKVQPEFDRLDGRRVAVVCVSKASSYGPNSVANTLARQVSSLLENELADVEMVEHEEIADWIDHNDWDYIDYREIGRGVKADYVVAIDLNAPINLREGPSLFKGRADITTAVYDMNEGGKVVFRRREAEFSYPTNARGDVSERQFRRMFTENLADFVARYFYPYAFDETIGREI